MRVRRLIRRVLALVAGGLLFSLTAFGAGYLTLKILMQGGSVEAPDLTGRPLVEALRRSRERDLLIWLDRETRSDELPRGWVISQEPPPGARIRRGRRISVVLSRGAARVEVPDLVGASRRLAAATIRRVGLRVGETLCSEPGEPGSTVVATAPAAGGQVPPDSRVDLLLGGETGPPVLLPDLAGRLAREVKAELAAAGLVVETTGSGAPGEARVAAQLPGPGAWLPPGERVTVALVQPEDTGLGPDREGEMEW